MLKETALAVADSFGQLHWVSMNKFPIFHFDQIPWYPVGWQR